MTVDINFFGRPMELEKVDHLSTGQPPEEENWYRWLAETESGIQIALLRSVVNGKWRAYVNYDAEEPPRRFNFWSETFDTPEDAMQSLHENVLSVGQVLSNAIQGKTPN